MSVHTDICTCDHGTPTVFDGADDATICEADGEDCSAKGSACVLTRDRLTGLEAFQIAQHIDAE